MLAFEALAALEGLAHGVTTRAGGVSRGGFATLNLGRSCGDDPAAVAENRRLVAQALGFRTLVTPRQVHGARVAEVHAADQEPGQADALMTDVPGVLLGVLGADCPGVLLVDPTRRALALVHSGWRGTAAGVLSAAIEALCRRYGSRPEDLVAGVGPGISQAAYEVGPDVAKALEGVAGEATGWRAPGRGDRVHVDLDALLAHQLARAGLAPAHVHRLRRCTFGEPEHFFSHRRDGASAGRHALLAGWRA